MKMSPDKIKEILYAIRDKWADYPCPRCKNQDFKLLHDLVMTLDETPTCIVVCDECGFMSHHSIKVLCSMNNEKDHNEHIDQ